MSKPLQAIKRDLRILKLAERDSVILKKSSLLYQMIADLERHIGVMERYAKVMRGRTPSKRKVNPRATR